MMQPRFRTAFCLVCGLQEHEVGRLHCFPSVQDRCRLWQEKMNMVFTGNTLHHHRICCNHFTEDQYVNRINWRLRRDAVPTLLPCSTVQRHLSITGESQIHKPETSTSMTETYPATGAEIQLNISNISLQTTEYGVAVETLGNTNDDSSSENA
ncbi:hypothetical protein ABEB36_010722 [Hypothenemus hampei]|uniref:THAP-type domain-containing protein n=2 Tax=Hypothenemus hampei TaxID=57062 RepID=A0ABD1ECX6_HYPHA